MDTDDLIKITIIHLTLTHWFHKAVSMMQSRLEILPTPKEGQA